MGYATYEQLRDMPTPIETDTWTPVSHVALVDAIRYCFKMNGKRIANETFYVIRHEAYLIGVTDTYWKLDNGCYITLGYRTSNKQHVSVEMVAGVRDPRVNSLAYHGEVGMYRRRHTGALDLRSMMNRAFDHFVNATGKLERSVNYMREADITKSDIQEAFFGVFEKRMIPQNYYNYCTDSLNDSLRRLGHNRWGLYNVFLEATKRMLPRPRHAALLKLGEMFTKWD
jgi:hypothetical protein